MVTSDLRLNEPRYVKLPEIMKAKKKPLETIGIADLGVEPVAQFRVLTTAPPPKRAKGIVVNDVGALVQSLRDRGLV